MPEEKYVNAKKIIDALANGMNPKSGDRISSDSFLNDADMVRAFFLASEALDQAAKSVPRAKKNKSEFEISYDDLKKFDYSEGPIDIGEITKRINDLRDKKLVKALSYKKLRVWLEKQGYLSVKVINKKRTNIPTESGIQIGIITEDRWNSSGRSKVALYSNTAQHFIIDHLPEILSMPEEAFNSNDNNEDDSLSLNSPKKTDFEITHEELERYNFSEHPITITEVTKRVNDLKTDPNMKKLAYSTIRNWLEMNNFLKVEEVDGKIRRLPTFSGEEIGVFSEDRINANGYPYTIVFYNSDAQHFIIDNLPEMIESFKDQEE